MTADQTTKLDGRPGPDLFRLSKSKKTVDVCATTMRQYNRQGLRFYRLGKCIFVSRSEFEAFVREKAAAQ